MKSYQKVTLLAKNSPSGSYAAGCPVRNAGNSGLIGVLMCFKDQCHQCERKN